VEALVPERIIDDPCQRFISLPEAERHGKYRKSVAKIARAVQRIDDPGRDTAVAGARRFISRPLFAEHEMLGERRSQAAGYQCLGCMIILSYQIDIAALRRQGARLAIAIA
jgi:hypothetical protein